MEITATLPAISAIGCFFVAWAAILYYCEKLYIAAALRYGITDKSSGGTIASGGGIIFPLAYIASEFFSLLTQGAFQYPLFLIGAVIIASVSFLDDAKPQSPLMRLAVHFACAALLVWQVCYTTGSAIPAWLIALLAIATVAIVNAFNFMDGIKGITGCYALSVILPLMAAGCHEHSELVLLALVPATAVFCTFNFRTPERCYCGDVGAIFLGYAAALFLCIYSISGTRGEESVSLDASAAIFIIVYLVDFSLTLLRRIVKRENLFESHHSHLYQRLAYECHIPHMAIAAVYALLQVAISTLYLFMPATMHLPYLGISALTLAILHTIIYRNIEPKSNS